jgi:DNA (cytosine-5)-methyltransferase 1
LLKTSPWFLKDLESIEKNGYKVMSCFHGGGGSTMGYKLSGFDVLGGIELDKKMMDIYRANHKPKYSFLMGINEFNALPKSKIPEDFFDLDILDGSPPCSSFSMSGKRSEFWGKAKKFKEGQELQILDDLIFSFIETARILQPKIIVLENVKGLMLGKAKGYIKKLKELLDEIGYDNQMFLLNSAFMGVPQRRERVFFISRKRSLNLPEIKLNFNEKPILLKQFSEFINKDDTFKKIKFNSKLYKYWKKCKAGKSFSSVNEKRSFFNHHKLSYEKVCPTIVAQSNYYHPYSFRKISKSELCLIQSFPMDFIFLTSPFYVCGMSVPPFMMNRLSEEIKKQLLDNLK